MTHDDMALVTRAIEHRDDNAFARLVQRHQSALRYSLRQLTGWDEALADDLAQETFIRAYKSLHQYRGEAKFFTWLYRIAYNCFLSHYRKRRDEVRLDEAHVPEVSYESDCTYNLHRDFARALKRFAPPQRMALHLHYMREYTHQEIADIMDCPLGTVKSYLSRGREKLEEDLMSWKTGALS